MAVGLKRAYESPDERDGYRVLVDRIWPRGLSKDTLAVDVWLKDVAPTSALRKWFGHDPERWEEFKRRYFEELAGSPQSTEELLSRARRGRVTLVFAASDVSHNNAVALKEYLDQRL